MNLGYIPQIPWNQFITIFISAVILLDFGIGISGDTEKISRIAKEKQQYYNPAKNSHYSYRVVTSNSGFYVDETVAGQLKAGDQLILKRSFIFQEVNSYQVASGESHRVYSLRILSGFFIPVLVILTMLASVKWKDKISVFAFIMQALLVGDLVYLVQ